MTETESKSKLAAGLEAVGLREDDFTTVIEGIEKIRELFGDRPKQRAMLLVGAVGIVLGAMWLQGREKAKA